MLEGFVAAAAAAWPELAVDPDAFRAFVLGRLPGGRVEPQALAKLDARELYLVAGCAAGLPQAIAALDASYLRGLEAELERGGASEGLAAEAAQSLREKLFVGDAPRIAQFSGLGKLREWLRVSIAREIGMLRRKRKREVSLAEPERVVAGALAAAAPATDPELAQLKEPYRAHFRAAFEVAAAKLTDRQRAVLRLKVQERLTESEIARVYQVHRASVARWIAEARRTILEETRAALAARLGASSPELSSVYGLIESQLDVSLSRLFAPKA